MTETLSARQVLERWAGKGASFGDKRNAIVAIRSCAAGGTLNITAERAVQCVDITLYNRTGRPVQTVENWSVPRDWWLGGWSPSPTEVTSWEAGNDVLMLSGTSWRLAGLQFSTEEVESLAPPLEIRSDLEGGPDYRRRLEAEHQEQEARREQAAVELLAGQWIRAADALQLMTKRGDRDSAAGALIRYAGTEVDKRATIRTRATLIQERGGVGGRINSRHDTIAYTYHWNGKILIQEWETGLFEITSDQIAGATFTLHGVQFSADDMAQFGITAGEEGKETMTPPHLAPETKRSRAGRKPAAWWPAFATELAVYIHEIGVPPGSGSDGQGDIIKAVQERMAEAGHESIPDRTSAQSVVQAILDRLRMPNA